MLALSLQRRFCWLPVPDAAVWFRTPDLCARTYFGISYTGRVGRAFVSSPISPTPRLARNVSNFICEAIA